MPSIQINPSRASTLLQNLTHITTRVSSTVSSLSTPPPHPIRLVAVSKLKPASDILALHRPPPQDSQTDTSSLDPQSGPPSNSSGSRTQSHTHFGENYLQELLEKSRLLPQTIKWHFIGGLQSNKCAQLAREVSSLWCVASVDSEKKATLLNKGRGERNERLRDKYGEDWHSQIEKEGMEERLRVFIQVNTSGEESKSGLGPLSTTSSPSPESSNLVSLARYISSADCPNLHLQGLMTIGALARSKASTPETENEDFTTLRSTRDKLAEELGMSNKDELELSMGMSEDFEAAIRAGSNEVRVGSTIFGERPAKKDAKVVEDAGDGGQG